MKTSFPFPFKLRWPSACLAIVLFQFGWLALSAEETTMIALDETGEVKVATELVSYGRPGLIYDEPCDPSSTPSCFSFVEVVLP